MTTSKLPASRFANCDQLIALIVLPVLILSGCSRVIHQQPATPPLRTGEIFVTSYGQNAVLAYRAGASGNVAPDLRIGRVLASPSGVAMDRHGRLYVTNAALNTISVFAQGDHGDMPPIATIRGGNTQLNRPEGITLDSSGKIYVTNQGFAADSVGSITVYQADAEGNVAPIATISGAKAGLRECSAVALDSSGRIYAAVGGDKFPASINVYPAGGHGDVAPIANIGGPKTGLSSPNGVAFDSKGRIYVTNANKVPSSSAVEVYPADSKGDVTPIATIRGTQTELGNPQGVALDSNGNIYVTNDGVPPLGREISPLAQDSANVYPAGSNGNVAPTVLIRGGMMGLKSPQGIALDPKGNIYVANTGLWNGYPGTVTVYTPASGGNVELLASIMGGPDTGIDRPEAIALDLGGNIYVANLDSSVTVYPAGTDHNIRPAATIKGANTRLCPNSIVIGPNGNIYVANGFQGALGDRSRAEENVSISIYPAASNGNVVPAAVISGTRTGLRDAPRVAVDSAGNIYVANGPGDLLEKDGRWVYRAAKGSVTVYRAGSNGDVPPIAAITGAHTGIDFSESLGGGIAIALDSQGRIYVVNSGGGFLRQGSLTIYPSLANLSEQPGYPDVKPITTISGVHTMLAHPQAVALDSHERIYMLNEDIDVKPEIDRITVYPALGNRTGDLDERPIATIEGSDTELDTLADGIAVLGPTEAPTEIIHPPANSE